MKNNQGHQPPQPLLEEWCRNRLRAPVLKLSQSQRKKMEDVCYEPALIRKWQIHAIAARSNHIHLLVTADVEPKTICNQLKANGTRVLRQPPDPITATKIWTRGADIEIVDDHDQTLERIITYITEAQERKDRDF